MLRSINIDGREIGKKQTPYIVAEISGNHNQDINEAKQLIQAAANAGVDAVKLQTYTPDSLTLNVKNNHFLKKEGLWKGRYLYELYQEGMTPWEWFPELNDFAKNLGLAFFSTPFDQKAVQFLEEAVNPPCYKIASYELNHIPLLQAVACVKKPVILSTGMGTEEEIDRAVQTLKNSGAEDIILLKCISAYPADPKDFNLKAIPAMEKRFECLVGISDHTLSHETTLGAVALGACFIEKHIILKRESGLIDCGFSLEPKEFSEMVQQVHVLHQALGSEKIGPADQEIPERTQRRSIFVVQNLKPGDLLSPENLRIVRPGSGLCPSRWQEVLGKKLSVSLNAGDPLFEGAWQD